MTNKERFIRILSGTGREGMDKVLEKLETLKINGLGFYDAPASTRFHLACKGGLLEHSLNVYDAAMLLRGQAIRTRPELEAQLPEDSVAICSLLHDVCKTDIYKETTLSRRLITGLWENYPGYTTDYEAGLPLGHGEKSVIMLLSWGLSLTEEEMLAIRWHMTAWDLPFQSPEYKSSLNAAKSKTPLPSLVQLADGFAAGLLERE